MRSWLFPLPVGVNLGARGERRPRPSSAESSTSSPPRLRSSPSSVRRESWGKETVLLLILKSRPKCLPSSWLASNQCGKQVETDHCLWPLAYSHLYPIVAIHVHESCKWCFLCNTIPKWNLCAPSDYLWTTVFSLRELLEWSSLPQINLLRMVLLVPTFIHCFVSYFPIQNINNDCIGPVKGSIKNNNPIQVKQKYIPSLK